MGLQARQRIADLTGRGFAHLIASSYHDDKKTLLPIAELAKGGNTVTDADLADVPGRSFRLDWDNPVLYVTGWKDAGFTRARQTVTAPMSRRPIAANLSPTTRRGTRLRLSAASGWPRWCERRKCLPTLHGSSLSD